ncbi:MAG: hypothetical protein HY710_03440 [Candidatus Latescibacteria bacterium]|nr:hypothetical protein [Candidatus Latescibacterota bacterium]
MVGKIRGYLLVSLVCLTFTVVAGVTMVVDFDRTWAVTSRWVDEHVPFLSRDGTKNESAVRLSRSAPLQLLAGAAFRAVKSGKARPGDLLDLGRLYYRARSDGHLDAAEFGLLVTLAQKTGIIDELLKQTPIPAATPGAGLLDGANSPIDQFRDLLAAFEQARADGRVETGEMLRLIEQARASGVEGQLAGMLPDGSDETRVRAVARDLFSAVASGEVSVSQMTPLIQTFKQAQADSQLDKQEVSRLTQMAEGLVRR